MEFSPEDRKSIDPKLQEEIQMLFKSWLGSQVEIEDNISSIEEKVFKGIMKTLEGARDRELSLRKSHKKTFLKFNPVLQDLWFTVENLCKLLYGESSSDLISWWLFSQPLEDMEGPIQSIEDLWYYIKRNHKEDENDPLF